MDLSNTLCTALRTDALYDSLAKHFMAEGRGRRPALPSFDVPTNKLLLQLYILKEECKVTWDEMTAWFKSIFPNMPVTRGRLEHRIKSLLVQNVSNDNLSQSVIFYVVPEVLMNIGLSREILLNENVDVSPVTISYRILAALETFRASEKLSQAFVFRWVSKFCPGYSDNQIRHKVTMAQKKLKDATKRRVNLENFLEEVAIPPLVTNQTDHEPVAEPLTLNSCECVPLKKRIRLLEEKLRDADERENNLKLTVEILKAERNDLKKYESLARELPAHKKKVSILEETIEALHSSKLYLSNSKLRKTMSKQETVIEECRERLKTAALNLDHLQSINEKMQKRLRSEQTLKSRYRAQKEDFKEKADSLQYLLQLDVDSTKTKMKEGNAFSPDVRMAVMQLQGEANVSASNCRKVIDIVAHSIFGMTLQKRDLPSTSTCLNIADEGHHIAKVQIGEEIKKSSSFTFSSDGTSRQKQHFMERHIQLENGKVLAIGFTSISSDSAKNMMEQTVEVLEEISDLYSESSDEDREAIFIEVLTKMKSLMSDRAANMKKFNQLLSEYKNLVLKTDTTTHFLYCNAHFLLGMSSAADEALKEEEKKLGPLGRDACREFSHFAKSNETPALRLIRTAADTFGPRGDEKNGCRQDWLMYCEAKNIRSKFSSHRSNRFNNIFENAAAVIFHRDHIKDFLQLHTWVNNLKTRSVLKDCEDANLLSIVAALALFNSLLTSPYWKLMNSDTPYGSFPPIVKGMEQTLERWISSGPDESPLLLWPYSTPDPDTQNFIASDDFQTSIFRGVFKAVATKCCIVLQRQLADFLEGGIFSSLSPDVKNLLDTCPLTNLTGERLFGDLDFDMQKRRRASNHHRSTIVMWKHNKTAKWLSKKSKGERKRLLKSAKQKGSALRTTHRQAEEKVKEAIKEKLEQTKITKNESHLKEQEMRSTLLNDIIVMGGVIHTKEELDTLFKTGKVEDIKVQLKFRKHFLGEKDLKVSGNKQELYNRLLSRVQQDTVDSDSDMDSS